MKQTGVFNDAYGADKTGFKNLKSVHWNYSPAKLLEEAIRNQEGQLSDSGAFTTATGQHTGRSVKDKFTVAHPEYADNIWWDNNFRMEPEHFKNLLEDFLKHAEGMDLYAQDLYGGADPAHRIAVRVYTEYAWHSLFIRHLLIRPDVKALASHVPEMTIIDLPSFKADKERHGARTETIIGVDFKRNMVLIGGTSYAGEMKKSVFTYLNYLLPEKGVIPMHCSANAVSDSDSAESSLFFGLSGTGKTTLSADPNRVLTGDDEHGWGENGIFNFEGGCYAKTINLSREAEPEIYAATERFGTVFENVVLDPETRAPDFDDGSLTENCRAAYPIDFMPRASQTGMAGHPSNIVMLTCDAFGVMPPIAKLSPSQAMYHYLSGYTAKVAGTEKGLGNEPQATFSTCFGAPFLPRHPSVYGNMLRDMIARHGTNCWLVNTGWTGGAFGTGSRMPIKATRALLGAALDGSLAGAPMRTDPFFGFDVPTEVPGVDNSILNPRETWADASAYDAQAKKLVQMFAENFATFEPHVDAAVIEAAPAYKAAAE